MRFPAINWDLVVAALALGWAVYVSWRDRVSKRKALSYHFTSLELTSGSENIFPGLKLTYEGRAIAGASIVIIHIVNSGSVPILKRDFEDPIRFRFSGNGEELLAHHEILNFPRSLNLDVTISDSNGQSSGYPRISAKPLLLNPRDRFSIAVLVSSFAGNIHSEARIAGISRIEMIEPRENVRLYGGTKVGLAVFTVGFLYLARRVVNHLPVRQPSTAIHDGIAALVGGSFVLLFIWGFERFLSRRS